MIGRRDNIESACHIHLVTMPTSHRDYLKIDIYI